MDERWLIGILACGLSLEAEAARRVLRQRGLATRSVPAGRALAAWTCAAEQGTVAIVVCGRGRDAARRAAGFWMHRAQTVAVVAAAIPTTTPSRPSISVDGDGELAAAAGAAAWRAGVEVVAGRVATVSVAPLTDAALVSLAGAGYAAIVGEGDAWWEAARTLSSSVLVCAGLVDGDWGEMSRALPAPGRASRSPWAGAARLLGAPGQRDALRRADAEITAAAERAAACAIAALLGPAPVR